MSQTQAAHKPHEEPALRALAAALRRHIAILVITVVGVPAGALAFSLSAEKQYTATAKLLFRDPGFDQKLFGGATVLGPSQDPSREAATNVGLVSLDTIAARASTALEGVRLTPSEIQGKVEVVPQGQSNVVAVIATDPKPAMAAELANTIAEQYIVFRREADRSKINQAVALVQTQLNALSPSQRTGREGRSATRQIEQLRTLANLQTGNAELVQPARPPQEPSTPRPVRAGFIGLMMGAAIGVLLAIMLERLDRRLRRREDAEAILGRPVLGSIPESRLMRRSSSDTLHLTGQDGEAFRTLRTNLRYFHIDKNVHSLLITSSAPGDGKSAISRHLAATAAASNVRTILLEADMRRPILQEMFGLRPKGLSDALSGRCALADVIQRLPIYGTADADGPMLDLVTAGALPPNPTDLLESDRMRDLLSELEQRYELVIIDTPPVTVVPDAIPLMAQVSGVAIVIREGQSKKTALRMLRKQLDHLGITPLGIIMNSVSAAQDSAVYGYYGYDPRDAESPPEVPDSGNGADSSVLPRAWAALWRRPPGAQHRASGDGTSR